MNKKISGVFVSCIFSLSANAAISGDQIKKDFYFGADIAKSSLSLKEGFGKNIFAKNPTEWSLHVGTKLTEMFGIEFGYTHQATKKRDAVTVGAGDSLPGVIQKNSIAQFQIVNSRLKGRHPYLGVFVEHKPFMQEKFKISALLGGSLSRLEGTHETIGDNFIAPYSSAQINASRRTYKKTKLIPIARISATYDINRILGVRAFGLWRNLSKFNIKSTERPESTQQIKFKNSYSIGFGLSIHPF